MAWHAVRGTRGRAPTWLALAALIIGLASPLAAQGGSTGSIRGRVTEAGTQRGIADAQVGVSGTALGAVTNANGEFFIGGVPLGPQVVSARRIGYTRRTQQVTIAAGQAVALSFELQMAASQLDAIVVTGTGGAVEKRTVGNAITTLDASEITSRASISNVTEVLQSKTPGVTILPGAGTPGAAGDIRIRGAGSISGYKPVVYVDGIRYNIADLGGFSAAGGGTVGLAQSSQVTSALDGINPQDIESIEVIKGPAAATLYGAEAANGVIQIITKKGQRGQQRMQFRMRQEIGVNQWHLLPDDNYTTCDAAKQAATVSATNPEPLWPGCQGLPVNTVITDNPIRRDPRAIRDGGLSRTSLSVRGGGDRYRFYLAGDRDTEQGVFFNSDNSRTSLRTNFGFNPNDKTDFQLNVNWSQSRLRQALQDESANGILISARRGLAGRRSLFTSPDDFGWRLITPTSANRYKNFTEPERFTMGAVLSWTPFRWFENKFTAGLDQTNTSAQLLFLPGDIEASQDPDAASGANLRREPRQRVLSLDYAGNIRRQIGSLESTTSFGSQIVSDENQRLDATGIGIGAVDVTLVGLLQRTTGNETYSENNSVGYYVQEQLGWNNRLFVTGALRADDHSSFGKNFDMILYPKLSLSYVATDEPALKNLMEAAYINSLKLRGAWGMAGRAPTAYSAPQTYTVDRVTLGALTGSAIRTSAYGNPDLKPEKGEELELGLDLGALDDRIGLDLTFYRKITSDMLQSISVAPSTGFISSRLTNLGKVLNTGLEVGLFGTPIQTPNFGWDTRINFSTNKNELQEFGVPNLFMQSAGTQPYGTVQLHRQGYPLGGYWVAPALRCGIDDPGTRAIMPCGPKGSAMLTTAGAAMFNPGDTARRYIGSSSPTREVGFSNTFTLFRNFRVYALLDYKGGFYNFNYQEKNRCLGANDNCARANDPRARFPQSSADSVLWRELAVWRATAIDPQFIEKADFVKLREVSLTMQLPQRVAQLARVQGASLVLSGRNLAVWSDYSGADPEVNSYGGRNFVRIDAYAAPMMRRLAAAIDLQF